MISILDVSSESNGCFFILTSKLCFCRQHISCLAALLGRSFVTVAATWQDGVGMHTEWINPGKITKTLKNFVFSRQEVATVLLVNAEIPAYISLQALCLFQKATNQMISNVPFPDPIRQTLPGQLSQEVSLSVPRQMSTQLLQHCNLTGHYHWPQT